jgi:glutamate dehydrogenase (NAD(P)+)
MEDMFRFADPLGPVKIVHIHLPEFGLKAIVVIDNIALGPAIGGVRMAPDVSVDECVRLARAMTLKNAAAALPHGGGKSVIVGNPRMPTPDKERVMRAFACATRDLADYIPGPDMGTGERCMAWIRDEIGRAVGLPAILGGIPLDEIGATGFGLAVAIEAALPYCKLSLKGARVAVQGFGAVGRHAARFLAERGAVLVAAADSSATVSDPDGLDVNDLTRHKLAGGRLADYPAAKKQALDAIVDIACDIWVPAARPDVLHAGNAARLRAKLVAQGANIPATSEAEAILHERGILVLPDFIANAGGVICAAVEYHGGTEAAALSAIAEKIGRNMSQVLEQASQTRSMPRTAAIELAEARIKQAAGYRRWR